MLTPQEIEVWYILPCLRKCIAIELKELGLSQKKISEIMDVTPSAVSQYFHNKRAEKIDCDLDKKIMKETAKKIFKTPENYAEIIQTALKKIKNTKTICNIHRKIEPIKKCCGICKI